MDLNKWITLPVLVLIFLFSMFLMKKISDTRLMELAIYLKNHDDGENRANSAILLQRFDLNLAGLNPAVLQENYAGEQNLMLMLSYESAGLNSHALSSMDSLAGFVINSVSAFTGGQRLLQLEAGRLTNLLTYAYYFERKRDYAKAIYFYQQAVAGLDPKSEEVPHSLLHFGFCLTMNGQKDLGVAKFLEVIRLARNSEAAGIAQKLIDRLDAVMSAERKWDQLPLSPEKGQGYLRLLAYHKAITIFNQLEAQGPSAPVYYFRGRSYEEIGNLPFALQDYQKVLRINPADQYAILANRRLFILGTFYEQNTTLKNLGEENLKQLKDFIFLQQATTKAAHLNKESLPWQKIAAAAENFMAKEAGLTTAVPWKQKDLDLLIQKLEPGKNTAQAVVTVDSKKDEKSVAETEKDETTRVDTQKQQNPLDPKISPAERKKLIIEKYPKVYKVYTIDGNAFVGAIIEEDGTGIKMITIAGLISIAKENIAMRTAADSKTAFE